METPPPCLQPIAPAATASVETRSTVASRQSGWEAHLRLDFVRRGERTLLARREHTGPLVVQKTLHPEGPAVCQAVVVHPPGGIAGGDRLALTIDVGEGAHAQLTTPGAAKWYRSSGATARQSVDARVAAGAVLEWLPQEAIVFDGARASLASRVELTGDAVFVAADVVCLGRIESGERFARGFYRQRFELVRDGALVWTERTLVEADDRLRAAGPGLNRCPMFGTFVFAAPAIADDLLAACRRMAISDLPAIEGAVTRLPGVLIARCRGASPEAARRWFIALWSLARPALCGCPAQVPRLWNT